MENKHPPRLLLHPAVVPAKWLLLADLLARMTEAQTHEAIEGLETMACVAGWLENIETPLQVRILGSERIRQKKPEPIVWDSDMELIDQTIRTARYREAMGIMEPNPIIEIVVQRGVEDAHS